MRKAKATRRNDWVFILKEIFAVKLEKAAELVDVEESVWKLSKGKKVQIRADFKKSIKR